MDLPPLDQLTAEEAHSAVVALVKDAERRWLTAAFNRTINHDNKDGAAQFDREIATIKGGLVRIKGDPGFSRLLNWKSDTPEPKP